MITGMQIRIARAALRWSVDHLAEKAGLGSRTIKRFEQVDTVPPGRSTNLRDVQNALEAAGIEFVGTPDDGPGIRLRACPAKS